MAAKSKGFTLLELIIVIAILGILSAVAVPQFLAYQKRANDSIANNDAKNFYKACVNEAVATSGIVWFNAGKLPPGYTGLIPISGLYLSASGWGGIVVYNAAFKHPNGTKTYTLNDEGGISVSP